jgi:hypothetical protein
MTSASDQPARGSDSPAGGSPIGGGPVGGGPVGGGTARTEAAVGTSPVDTTGQRETAPRGDAAAGYVPRQAGAYDAGYTDSGPSGAALGFTMLAAVLMMLSGVWGFFEGLAAIIKSSAFIVLPNYAFSISTVAWGWIHLILGVLIAAAGVALLRDMLWARVTGVVLASLITISNFLFIPYYPVWSIVVIALNLFVIWALLTPRRESA